MENHEQHKNNEMDHSKMDHGQSGHGKKKAAEAEKPQTEHKHDWPAFGVWSRQFNRLQTV